MAKGGDIGNFGRAAERHCSLASAPKRRRLSSGPEGRRSKWVGFCQGEWPHGAAANQGLLTVLACLDLFRNASATMVLVTSSPTVCRWLGSLVSLGRLRHGLGGALGALRVT